ncbi:MAG: hypothetical protein O9322_03955 [Beijerinckiaceae bacterium]|nr:hypothetical protein [Beijerinckiaceae bacterium]MCZ8298672.1 hypothetical protein [Beijerinckiaceae bacterium]
MTIDWTQTLMGASALASHGGSGMAAALAGRRLLGVLAGSLAMGLSLATLPFRGLEAVLPEWIGLSGVLAASVCGFVLLSRERPVSRLAGLFSGLLVLPFAAFAGVGLPILALLSLLSAALGLADWLALRNRPRPARAIAGIAVLATIACFLQGPLDLAAVAPAIAMTVPLALGALRQPAAETIAIEPDPRRRLGRLEALNGLLLRGGARQVLVVDQVGALDAEGEAPFRRHLLETHFPERSVVAATLIADRVPLLQALSRAIHEDRTTEGLVLRLRRDPAGAGFPLPPRYDRYTCTVAPLPGEPGLAIFLYEPAERVAAEPSPARKGDPALLSRALHDSVAPFNAGLGFLEMLADPRLAPRDPATTRDFAAEAHKAIGEAHRNTHLMGRWLRALQDGPDEPADILPNRLLSDGIRALNLREAQDRGLLAVTAPAGLPAARLPLPAARFAVEIMLRRAMAREGARLEWLRDGADLLVTCHAPPSDEAPMADPFEAALCEALAGESGIGFSAAGGRDLTLRFAGAYAGRLPVLAGHETIGEEPIRIAG